MIIHELQEPIPVEVKHLGKGVAILIECGMHDYKWTIVFETRAIVTVPQNKVLVQKDFTNNRGISAKMLRDIIGRVVDDTVAIQGTKRQAGKRVHAKRRCDLRAMRQRASRDVGRTRRRRTRKVS